MYTQASDWVPRRSEDEIGGLKGFRDGGLTLVLRRAMLGKEVYFPKAKSCSMSARAPVGRVSVCSE